MRNGLAADGRQRYLCRDCGQRSREDPPSHAHSEGEREQILRAYEAYASVIPQGQHAAVGKESGRTAHAGRWGLTPRQRPARCVRRTLRLAARYLARSV